ncbi:MAG: exodeoxyribonuclease VII small subunit [Lachnospiraceae bacterium]
MGRTKSEAKEEGKKENKQEITIDEGFAKLQDILTAMDAEGISLEDSFKLYNDGVLLVKELSGKLNDAENSLTIVNEE